MIRFDKVKARREYDGKHDDRGWPVAAHETVLTGTQKEASIIKAALMVLKLEVEKQTVVGSSAIDVDEVAELHDSISRENYVPGFNTYGQEGPVAMLRNGKPDLGA